MISKDIDGWEEMLPKGIAELIKRDKLFGFSEKKELEQKN